MTITEDNFVAKAEKTIKELKELRNSKTGKPLPMVTTSQIRNLLAMTADIYNSVRDCDTELLSEEVCGRIQYLKIRMIYESGRTPAVKNLILKSDLLKIIDEINGKKQNFLLFNKYMEALVAYHKFYGGKD